MSNLKSESINNFLEKAEFKCQQCSRCCRIEPGVVFLTKEDAEKITEHLEMSMNDFIKKCCREIYRNGKKVLALQEKSNYDCIFWSSGCIIYPARPVQCITYPFWPFLVENEAVWKNESKKCPGINKPGTLTPLDKKKYYTLEKNVAYMEYPDDL